MSDLLELAYNNQMIAIPMLGLMVANNVASAADAVIKDTGADSPKWLKILSKVLSVMAANVGKAKNDAAVQK